MRIQVTADNATPLAQTVWTFYVVGTQFVLDAYVEYTRPSTRHLFRAIENKVWYRLDRRKTTMDTPKPSLAIMRQAMQEFAAGVTFTDAVRESESEWIVTPDHLNFKVRTE